MDISQNLQVAINKRFGVKLSDNTCRNTKTIALKKIHGDHKHQFKLMLDYAFELKRSHPGSTVLVEYEDVGQEAVFKRIYICLKPLVEGFKMGCRRLIGLDGCHTKGVYRQQILTAVALDLNNGWWPLAWAVVEQENQTTWAWFLQFLVEDLGIHNNCSYVFISDKQKVNNVNIRSHILPPTQYFMLLTMNHYRDFLVQSMTYCHTVNTETV